VSPAGSRTRGQRRARGARCGVVIAGLAGALALGAPAHAQTEDVARGRALFQEACSTCHGDDARGRPGQAPSLHGAGAQSADFYLSTGRMPLPDPEAEPLRTKPAYSSADRRALIAYVASFGGPGIPRTEPEQGDIAEGQELFTSHCAGCHQVVAQGGVVPGAVAPALQDATATQIAEAVRVGPYIMPAFSERQIDQAQLDSIVRDVLSTRTPPDRGGWGIGNIGPIPEGMVAWLLAGAALVLIIRLIGKRA
jgi:ubiquinol-cytochrome c reductase cytochrome c subunit